MAFYLTNDDKEDDYLGILAVKQDKGSGNEPVIIVSSHLHIKPRKCSNSSPCTENVVCFDGIQRE